MTNKHFSTVILSLIIGVFVLLTISGIILNQKNQPGGKAAQTVVEQNPAKKTGFAGKLYLNSAFDRSVFTVGEPIRIIIYADSGKEKIEGYDAVLVGDFANRVIVSKAQSLLPDFEVVESVRPNSISLTGIKKIDSKNDIIIANSAIAELTLTAPIKGVVPLQFDFSPGVTRDSNLVNHDVKDVLQQVVGMTIFIGEKKTLAANRVVALDSGITAQLVDTVMPPTDCRDCITVANIKVTRGGESKILEYKSGGFTGLTEMAKEVFNYRVEVETISKNSVTVYIAKF